MSTDANHWEVGTDIGGTFTDIIAIRHSPAEARIAKVPSRPQAPVQAMLEAIEAVGLRKSEIKRFVHGTTRVTNAIVEGRAESGTGGDRRLCRRAGDRALSPPRSLSSRRPAKIAAAGAAGTMLRAC